jgi:hypothetical protein
MRARGIERNLLKKKNARVSNAMQSGRREEAADEADAVKKHGEKDQIT